MCSTNCAGCLGDGDCWVCLGIGHVEVRRGSYRRCHRCSGTGNCVECRRRATQR